MNEEIANEILHYSIRKDGIFSRSLYYMDYKIGNKVIILEGVYKLEELKAIVWFMENKG